MKRLVILLTALALASTAHAGLTAYYDFEGTGADRFDDPAGDFPDNLVGQYNPAFSSDVSPNALGSTQSASFNGNSALFTDAFTTDLGPDSDALTIMFWVKGEDILQENNNTRLITSRVKPDGTATLGSSWQVEGFGNNGSNGDSMDVRYQPFNGVYPANWFSPDATNALANTGETAEWRHVAFVLANTGSPNDGGAYGQTFVDGVQVGSISNPDAAWDGHTLANLEGQLIIGGNSETAGNRAFTGLLDDVALFSGAVDATTINQIATGAISPADLLGGAPVALLETDFTGRTVSGATASNITWVTNGLADPGNLTVTNETPGTLPANALFDTPNAAGHFAVDKNIENEGPWSVTIPLSLTAPSVTLTDLVIDWQHFNNSGAFQGANRIGRWTASVTGSTSGLMDSVQVTGPNATSGIETLTFGSPLILNNGETYDLKIFVDSPSGTGNNTGFDGLTLNGIVSSGGPVVLIDDHFDNNDLGTDVNGVNGGFVKVSNTGGGAGSASEAGTVASMLTTGSNDNTGIVSISAIDTASLGTHGFEMYFNIDSISADPATNGMFLGLQDDGTSFFRLIDNFGLVFSGTESRTSSANGFGLVLNDNGSGGASHVFDHADLQLPSLLDGFEAWITADATGWGYEITGVNDTGGAPATFSNTGTWVAAGLPADFFGTFFDATDHVAVYLQQNAGVTTNVDRITVTDLTPAGPTGLVWNGSDNDFGTANWDGSPPTFPDAGTDATINDGQVTVEANHAAQSLAFNGGTLIIGTGNTLTITDTLTTAAGSTLTLQPGSTLALTDGTIEGVLNSPGGPSTVELTSGTLVLDNPATDAANINFDSNDGMLKVYYGNGLNNASVSLTNSTLHIEGVPGDYTDIPALNHYGYHRNADGSTLNLDSNGGMMNFGSPETFSNFEGHGLLTVGPGDRGLDFNNDGDFRAVPASILDDASGDGWVIDRANNYSNMWQGTFIPDVSGTWYFRNAGDDDRAGIWLDIDRDGVFESSQSGLGSNRGEQLSWESTAWYSADLVAGLEYMIAFTHREGGGGSRADFRFYGPATSAIVSETVVKPADPLQGGMWLADGPGLGAISAPGTDITVVSDSALVAVTSLTATFGSLTFDPTGGSAVLTVSDAAQGIIFADTSIASPGAIGIDAQCKVTLTSGTGDFDGNGHAATFTKTGPQTMIVGGAGTGLGSTTFSLQEGLTIAVAGGGGGPLNQADIELAGGRLLLSSAGGDQLFDNGLVVQQPSVLGAGAAGGGVPGPLTVTLGSPANPTVLNGDLTVDVQDNYSLVFGGDLSGPGGIDSLAGNVNLNGPGNQTYSGATFVSGGLLTTNAPVTDTATLDIDGGDAVINAPLTTTGGATLGLGMRGFMSYAGGGRADIMIDLEGNGGLLSATPVGDAIFSQPLNLSGDATFRALIPEITRDDDYQSLWVGTFTPQVTGVHEFDTPSSDDRGGIWIDLDQDGVFERQGDAGDERVSWEGGNGTRTLTAGVNYAMAVVHMEHGGGSTIHAQFREPAGGTYTSLTTIDPSSQTLFTTDVPNQVSVDNGTLDINAPVTTGRLFVGSNGTVNANVADALPGVPGDVYGLVNANADAALRGSAMTANYAAVVNIGAAQSAGANFGNIIVTRGGILTGNLTNATYGAGGIELQPGAILAPTAGSLPTYAQAGGAVLYERITNVGAGATYNWGDNGTTPYMGGAFSPNWTPGGDFVSTVNDVSPGQVGLQFITVHDDGDRNDININGSTTLNTANTTVGAHFMGAGEVELEAPWSGTATVLTRTGNFDDALDALVTDNMNTTNDWILRINSNSSNGALGAGQTANVSNGRVSYRNVNSLAAGATLNINEDGTLYMNDSADGRRPARGTININPGGLVWLNANNRLTNGADFTFDPDAWVMFNYDANVNTADPTADGITKAGFDNMNIIISDNTFSQGLYLGAGRRLTHGWGQGQGTDQANTVIRKSLSADPTGSFVIFSSSGGGYNSNGVGGDLDINSAVALAGVDIYINDAPGTLISLPQSDGNVTRRLVASDGRVNIDRHLLECDDIIVRNGYLRLGDNNDFDIDSTGRLVVGTNSHVELQGDRPLIRNKVYDGTLFPGGIFVDNNTYFELKYQGGDVTINHPITFTGVGTGVSRFEIDEDGPGGYVELRNLIFEEGAQVGIDRSDLGEGQLDMYITLTGNAMIERQYDVFDLYDVLGPGHTLTAGNPLDSNDLTNRPNDQRFDLDFFGTVTANIDLAHVRAHFHDGSDVLGDAVVNSRSPLTVSGRDGTRIRVFAGEYGPNPISGGIWQLSGNDGMQIDVRQDSTNNFSGTVRIIDDGDLGTQDGQLRVQREGGGGNAAVNVQRLEVGPGARGWLTINDNVNLNIAQIQMQGTGSELDLNGADLSPDYVGGVGLIFDGDITVNPGGVVEVGTGVGGLQLDVDPFPVDSDVTFRYSIDGPSPGVYFEQLIFPSLQSLDLNSAWLDADIVPYGAVQVGDTVTILEMLNGSLTGEFRDPVTGNLLPEGASFFVGLGETSADMPHVTWEIHYLADQVQLTALQLVPEPGTATLLGLSLLALARRRRHRK